MHTLDVMQTKPLSSQITFIIALILSVGTITAACLFNVLHWNKQHLIYLGFSQSLVAIITPIGIFAALKYKPQQLKFIKRNRFFLWGNIVLLLYTLSLMTI